MPRADCTPRRRARLEAFHQEEREYIASSAAARSTTDTGSNDLALVSNWMHRTAWAQTFSGANRALLLSLTKSPALTSGGLELGYYNNKVLRSSIEDERVLAIALRAVEQFFDRYEDTVRHTDRSIRC